MNMQLTLIEAFQLIDELETAIETLENGPYTDQDEEDCADMRQAIKELHEQI